MNSTRTLATVLAILLVSPPALAQSGSDGIPAPKSPEGHVVYQGPAEDGGYGEPRPTGRDTGVARPGRRGSWVLGVESLFGFNRTTYKIENASESMSHFSFLGSNAAGPYTAPRLALDAFAADWLTVGGSFALTRVSIDDGGSATGRVLHPRVGFFAAGDRLSLWARTGIALAGERAEGSSLNFSALALEALVLLHLLESGAFTLGPSLFLPMGGTVRTSGVSENLELRVRTIGVNAGLSFAF